MTLRETGSDAATGGVVGAGAASIAGARAGPATAGLAAADAGAADAGAADRGLKLGQSGGTMNCSPFGIVWILGLFPFVYAGICEKSPVCTRTTRGTCAGSVEITRASTSMTVGSAFFGVPTGAGVTLRCAAGVTGDTATGTGRAASADRGTSAWDGDGIVGSASAVEERAKSASPARRPRCMCRMPAALQSACRQSFRVLHALLSHRRRFA
jgi:hypothetical protein